MNEIDDQTIIICPLASPDGHLLIQGTHLRLLCASTAGCGIVLVHCSKLEIKNLRTL